MSSASSYTAGQEEDTIHFYIQGSIQKFLEYAYKQCYHPTE